MANEGFKNALEPELRLALAEERLARQEAEAAIEQLRESEERFRLTIDEAPIGMALVDLDGRFVRVNRVLCEIVGYSADELTGLTFQEITHPEDLEADLALVRRLARGEIPRFQVEKRYIRKDRTVVDAALSVSMLRAPDRTPRHYIAQVRDISERKRLEKRLRVSEARSSGIVAISADAIISIDDDQRITLFNAGAERIFGYANAEAIGARLDMLIPERYRAAHRRHVERFAAGTESARRVGARGSSIVGLRKNGEEFPADAAISKLEVDGEHTFTVTLRDITEQKRIENAQRFLADVGLALSDTLDYDATLTRIAELAVRDIADLCVVDVVDADGIVRRVKVASRDPAKSWLCEMLAPVSLARDRPFLARSVLTTRRSLLLQEPSPEVIASLSQSRQDHRALRAADIRSMVVAPLLAHRKLLGAIVLIASKSSRGYDRADVRLAEELARRAALSIENARLYRAAQRASQVREEVLEIVAHDLRNPASTILAQTEMLRYGAQPKPGARKPSEAIERAARRMLRLIRDLLDETSIQAGRLSIEPANVAPETVISDSVERQRPLAAASSLELQLDLSQPLPELWADRDRLLQVFENLLANALAFTSPGGQITVGALPRDTEVLFWVRDTGRGIPAKDLPRVFDRFWQRRRGRGAGLGLAIVKGIIEAHHGRIWVKSTPGEGTIFCFTIPAASHARALVADRP